MGTESVNFLQQIKGAIEMGLFEPFCIKGLELKNRIVMVPMCMYMAAQDGKVTQWHQIHYGARAFGGCGLIIQEATAVEKRGRLSDNDLGIWSDEHVDGLAKLVQTVHSMGSRMAVQIAHGGRKSWPGGEPIVAPSPLAFSEKHVVPKELSEEEAVQTIESFRLGARRAVQAGYDAIEIHGAHGYLIHEFLSPSSNKRSDQFGGSFGNRISFALEVIKAVKGEIPESMPLFIRVSADEFLADGYTPDEMIEMTKEFKRTGADLINVSTGGASAKSVKSWPGYQLPYAERIRKATGIPVIGCGLITTGALAEEAINNGRADLIGIGRALLSDPQWPLAAAKELSISGMIPQPYKRAYPSSIS
jgi:NADPH2 dehydrogenase